MRVYSLSLCLLLLLFVPGYYPSIHPAGDKTRTDSAENREINRVVREAVNYDGWITDPDYREQLARFFDGELLAVQVNAVEQFRKNSTDWHTLTFIKKCHIVYNDGNRALVKSTLQETGPDGTGQGTGVFSLHKTAKGWRITGMHISWASP